VIRPVVAALALAVTGAGCAGGHDCTTIGGVSQVFVDVAALGPTVTGSTVCVDGACTDSLGSGQALAPLAGGPGRHDVAVTVHGPDGRDLAKSSGTFTTTEQRPNGEGCDPVLQQINLVMDAGGHLSPR
jgi:hypothetical protein